MNILGVTGPALHDNSAALFVDGKLVARAEEERFIRVKHAKRRQPINAIRFCLAHAGTSARSKSTSSRIRTRRSAVEPARWHYARRHWYEPGRALRALYDGNRKLRRKTASVLALLDELGIGARRVRFVPVEHHLAHASSAYHLSGFDRRRRSSASTARGIRHDVLRLRRERQDSPDQGVSTIRTRSAGCTARVTEYLGFEIQDGEYKVMGMAPYGDPDRYDFSRLVRREQRRLPSEHRAHQRHRPQAISRERQELRLQPMRSSAGSDPCAAATTSTSPTSTMPPPRSDCSRTRRSSSSTTTSATSSARPAACASPAASRSTSSSTSGFSSGRISSRVRASRGRRRRNVGRRGVLRGDEPRRAVQRLEHVYLGPSFSTDECIAACRDHPQRPRWLRLDDAPARAAEIIAEGNPLAWFQGRMEFGPRALGNRSILGDPEPRRDGRAHQCANQVPRALAAVLPEHARHRRARHPAVRIILRSS
jgi:carbamoyltransferase